MVLLQVNRISKHYEKDKPVLTNISLNVKQGEFISIIGPSGAGKSTLLRCMNRMIDISDGEIHFDGTNMMVLNKRHLRKYRTKIGMIFQHYNLVSRLTVIENVLHGRLGYKSTIQGVLSLFKEDEKREAFQLLEKLGMVEHAYKRCDQLSGGQKQRVGIARALIQSPKLLLCDEPIASLDPNSSKIIMDHLKEISTEMNITCIVNLHQVDVAKKYSDRIIGLNTGEIVYDGSSEDLVEQEIRKIYGADARQLMMK